MAGKDEKDGELGRGEVDPPVVEPHFVAQRVDGQRAGGEDGMGLRRPRRSTARTPRGVPGFEGLRDVVIGAEFRPLPCPSRRHGR
jgi:hypothetical protein